MEYKNYTVAEVLELSERRKNENTAVGVEGIIIRLDASPKKAAVSNITFDIKDPTGEIYCSAFYEGSRYSDLAKVLKGAYQNKTPLKVEGKLLISDPGDGFIGVDNLYVIFRMNDQND